MTHFPAGESITNTECFEATLLSAGEFLFSTVNKCKSVLNAVQDGNQVAGRLALLKLIFFKFGFELSKPI